MISRGNAASLALIGAALLGLGSAAAVQAQARRWVVPDQFIDFTANGPKVTKLPTPVSTPVLAPHYTAANSVFDSNGKLLFYVMNLPSVPTQPPLVGQASSLGIYDADNEGVAGVESDDSVDQIAVFASPNKCDVFDLVYFHYTPGFQGGAKVELLLSSYDASQKKKSLSVVSLLGCVALHPHSAFVVGRLRQGNDQDYKTRFLYSIACGEVRKLVVDADGLITVDSTLLTVQAADAYATQAVLSSDGEKLAWSNGGKIFVANLDPITGDNLTSQPTIYPVASATGLAFSPDGNLLFFSPSAQKGGPLFYIDLKSSSPAPVSLGIFSKGYAGSLLQLSTDQKIYAAGVSDLGVIDPAANPPTFTANAIPQIKTGLPQKNDKVVTQTIPYQINGEAQLTCENLCGNPVLIQSSFGQKGNFEVVVPHPGGGLDHYWRDNDGSQKWYGPQLFGADAGAVDAVSLIQSSYDRHLEVVARIDDQLVHFWRDLQTWTGPLPVAPGLSVSVTVRPTP